MLARNLMPVKYLNNRLESDHGKLKRLIKPTLGFQVRRIGRVGWNHTRRRCPESYHDCEYQEIVMFLSRFLKNLIRSGELTVIDATGRTHRFGGGTPAVTIRLHDPALHWRLFFDPEMAAGEAYMHGTLTGTVAKN